jgi:HSP20 family molecular chaperone IbpA
LTKVEQLTIFFIVASYGGLNNKTIHVIGELIMRSTIRTFFPFKDSYWADSVISLAEDLFSAMSLDSFSEPRKNEVRGSYINYSKKEEDNKLTYSFQFPGVEKEDIEITTSAEDREISLNIEIKKDSEFVHKGKTTFSIPSDADLSSIKSSLAQGILTIEIPKKEKEKIKINIE